MSMTKEETTYTVFTEYGYQDSHPEVGHTVEEICAWYGRTCPGLIPVAWCAGSYFLHGRSRETARDASIAAGRLIELVDGKYVARGVPVEDKPAIPAPTDWVANARARVQKQRAADPNYEMIRRDGFALSKPAPVVVLKAAPAPTTKPSPFARFRSPDLIASTHQADPQHQLKG